MKSIETSADLAINGAPPAFAETLHVGRPNIGARATFDRYIDQIYSRNWLTNDGPLVRELEHRVAEFHQVEQCIAMANGTIALEIAIRALDLTGEVIIPSYTFIATAHALHWQALTPVFADIDPLTHNLDPHSVSRMITPRTSGIIGVHLWGRAAPVDELQALAEEHNLRLLFDAAHAFGCSYKGRSIGNFGSCEVLSFHATKYFNTVEGGAVLTNDPDLAQKMRLMRNFGFAGMDKVIHPGINGKMSEVSAAMGLVNLESIDEYRRGNELTFRHYQEAFANISWAALLEPPESERSNYQYVVVVVDENDAPQRDDLIRVLHAENVRARRYFWPGCHRMAPYQDLYPHAGLLLPHTEKIARQVIVLPGGGSLRKAEIETIAKIFSVMR
jgi:dTDP-4-amino-4,6-dideoxygalactose transaminase